jgi:predicted outer membrane repeat protein
MASANGGAVFNSAVGGNSNPIFTNCGFRNNTAVNGGAVYSDGRTSGTSSPSFINCSFDNNSATTSGSVLYNLCTAGTCLPDFKNCIFWNNGGNKTFFNTNATITASYSLLESTVTNYTNLTGNLSTTTTPFVAVSNLRLSPCSSAINTGSNIANGSLTDLDGNLRKFGVIDMGAYEFQNTQVTLPSGTNNLTICNNTTASLIAICATGFIKWYDAAGTNLLFTGSPFNTPNLTTNTAYKVRCDDGTCMSNFVDITVSVNTIPPMPNVINDTTIAVGETLILTAEGCLSGTGNSFQWYKSEDNSLVTMPVSPTIITNYYAKCLETTNGVTCASSKSSNVEVSIADIISIITGNWENDSIWNLGRVPFATDFVIIGENHTVTVTTDGANAKKVRYRNNAKINLGNSNAKLKLGN